MGQYGATLAVPRVKALALEHGLSETGSGELVSFAADGTAEFTIRRFDDSVGKPPGTPHHTGLTFALDLPHVAEPARALSDMISIAASMAEKLGGELVDDNRRPLTEAGLVSIRRSLDKVVHDMEAHGVTPGSALARRSFAMRPEPTYSVMKKTKIICTPRNSRNVDAVGARNDACW